MAAKTKHPLEQALENFLASKEFESGVTSATRASWGGSGYSVEIFEDGSFRVLWDNQIGNKYESPGLIMSLPKFDDDDYHECLDAGMSEEEYFSQCFAYQQDELADDLCDTLSDHLALMKQYEAFLGEE